MLMAHASANLAKSIQPSICISFYRPRRDAIAELYDQVRDKGNFGRCLGFD